MTEQSQIYLADTYVYEADAEIIGVETSSPRARIALAQNIFHPQGGGQPDDRGVAAGVEVTPSKDAESGWVWLTLPEGVEPSSLRLAEGTSALSRIDPGLRRLHAALHTAGHLVDALVRPHGFQHTGNNHFPGQARIEYAVNGTEFDKDELAVTLTTALDKAIAEALPVTAGERDGRRTITIEGLATEFCGGTHVTDLGLLTAVAVRSVKVKSGRLRIGYTAEHAGEGT
ncbi:alanyl-tRNA synthetase [Streptomyces massasporeus]|uniref:alanyl-tRNA synthetase n=1 Tax=Streptomyces massasporeus TaxID=67324 RepID=UPI001679846E|nr:alanyl-tRNA synthetase [Streptomyces massasporeus]GGV91777.1 alanyl-tRNA synthetase [Streptomyces massasporeus]